MCILDGWNICTNQSIQMITVSFAQSFKAKYIEILELYDNVTLIIDKIYLLYIICICYVELISNQNNN